MQQTGDLSTAAPLGSKVRCVRTPDITYWMIRIPHFTFAVPEVGMTYYVRAHVRDSWRAARIKEGVLLSVMDKQSGQLVPFVNYNKHHRQEPIFPYNCFTFISRP